MVKIGASGWVVVRRPRAQLARSSRRALAEQDRAAHIGTVHGEGDARGSVTKAILCAVNAMRSPR